MSIGGPKDFRKVFTLSSPPPRLYTWNRRSDKKRDNVVGLFEPYPENLPLEAGFYTFVLDERGRFHVDRRMTSSHASLVSRAPIGAAGSFRITRAGKVGEVDCRSLDYGLWADGPSHPLVRFVIEAFRSHQAFDVSRYAFFSFTRSKFDRFFVTPERDLVADVTERQRLLEAEGQGTNGGEPLPVELVERYATYTPEPPPRLYRMHQDQLAESIDINDLEAFQFGDFDKPYGPAAGRLSSGRKAFVIDPQGRLIIGYGHHLLSGGRDVGAAGQIYVDDEGVVTTINLNFSGHYRPPLSSGYAHYTFKSLVDHPLLMLAPDYVVNGRLQFALDGPLTSIELEPEVLLANDYRLEYLLGEASDDWGDPEEEETD